MSGNPQKRKPGPKPKPLAQVPTELPGYLLAHLPPSSQSSLDTSTVRPTPFLRPESIDPAPISSISPPSSSSLAPPTSSPMNPSSIHTSSSVNLSSISTDSSINSSFAHTIPRLRAEKQSEDQKREKKFADLEHLLKTWNFDSLGDFLEILFYNHRSRSDGPPDPRGAGHAQAVSKFLRSQTRLSVADFIVLIYKHPSSSPRYDSERKEERISALHPNTSMPPSYFHYAAPCLFTWAVHTVARLCNRQMISLTKSDTKNPDDPVFLRATTNGCTKNTRLPTWDDISSFSFKTLEEKYQSKAAIAFYLLQSMCTRQDNTGAIILRVRRPHKPVSFLILQDKQVN
jgi:hypothetical protein